MYWIANSAYAGSTPAVASKLHLFCGTGEKVSYLASNQRSRVRAPRSAPNSRYFDINLDVESIEIVVLSRFLDVAQLGSALALGASGRGFNSLHPDQLISRLLV